MALIDITPVMTSDTEPAPYMVSASSQYSGLSAFKVFREFTEGNSTGWRSTDGDKEKWIQLDFGEIVGVSAIKITPRTGVPDVVNSNAKIIRLSGFDGSNWIDIYENSDETALVKDKENLIEFNSMWQFSKFRIQVLRTFKGTSGFTNISRINFLYDDKFLEPIMPVSYRNATLEHTLPMNTTANILAKQGDARLGLLGLANDGENFGDLYVVGRDGRSHLTKAGMKSEIIFDGVANAENRYELSKNVKMFKELLVYADSQSGSDDGVVCSCTNIFVDDKNINKPFRYVVGNSLQLENTTNSYNILFCIDVENNELVVNQILESGSYRTNSKISKIIGIY